MHFFENRSRASLTRAAEALFVTQSALSLTIRHLEDDLGVLLFERSTRRLDLTLAGLEFLPLAQRLLQQFDSVMHDMRALGKQERARLAWPPCRRSGRFGAVGPGGAARAAQWLAPAPVVAAGANPHRWRAAQARQVAQPGGGSHAGAIAAGRAAGRSTPLP